MPDETVIPLHSFDDNDVTRGSLLYLTLSFDAVLDVSSVRRSLETLITIGQWNKLGARLRKTNGKLEYHVPTEFTEQRPGFVFSREEIKTKIDEHPLACKLPRPTNGTPSVQNDPKEFISLARRPDGPKKLADYLHSDEPQLSLHVVSFNDATLVTLSWLHTLCDATAMSDVLKSMVLILQGRQAEVPQVFPVSMDPFKELGPSPPEPYVNESRQLVGMSLAIFFVRFFINLMWYRNAQRIIYLPPKYIPSLKAAANEELDDATLRLSEGDILSVVLTKLALRKVSPNSNQNMTIWNVLDVRGPLASTVFSPASSVYLGNAVLGVIAFIPAHQFVSKSLSAAAAAIRRAVEEQRTPAQIHALAVLSEKAKKEGRPCLFGDAKGRLFFYSNWTRAGFFELDFGVATMRPHSKPLLPTTVLFNSEAQHPVKTNTILGKDSAGGYWIEFNMEDGNWDGVQQLLESLLKESV